MEFDKKAVYRLLDVQDHAGRSKVSGRSLYQDRIQCLATNLRLLSGLGQQCVHMDFVQDSQGKWINRHLRTSPVTAIEDGDVLKITTLNSVYLLEPAELAEDKIPSLAELLDPDRGDPAELIELYLSEEGHHLCRGLHHIVGGTSRQLVPLIHSGLVVDSCLICELADQEIERFLCRYYLQAPDDIEFYDTLYGQQDYSVPILIHNCGKIPLKIHFERSSKIWTIAPDEEKVIRPYCSDGENS